MLRSLKTRQSKKAHSTKPIIQQRMDKFCLLFSESIKLLVKGMSSVLELEEGCLKLLGIRILRKEFKNLG